MNMPQQFFSHFTRASQVIAARLMGMATWLLLLAVSSGVVNAVPTFNRTIGEVRLSSCEGLKSNVELGLDLSIVIEADLLCKSVITLVSGQGVTIASELNEEYKIVIAAAFSAPGPTAVSLIVNPQGGHLTLERLEFINEAGATGVARAVWNAGVLDVAGCTFVNLNFAGSQDGGAIYSFADPGNSEAEGLVSVWNSTFYGNIGRNHGGALMAQGTGSVKLSNCTFTGNEAVGYDGYSRTGSGGAVYASPGVHVSVFNSSFEGCLGRYGGSALFLCGGVIEDSTLEGNEASGVLGAVVNGDLSEEERLNASYVYGNPSGQDNYTCSELSVSGSIFVDNSVIGGYGGSIASIDASLSVSNSSFISTTGGALYFGTSDDSGRDQLKMDFIIFNYNEGSDASPDFVGAAYIVELSGSSASNSTGEIVDVPLPSSTTSVTIQSIDEGTSSSAVVGTGRDLYCFESDPYECEGYFGNARIELAGIHRCSVCGGDSFTGIGSPEGVPTPAPVGFDDDDGLSNAGQERAQGGTPSPTPVGGVRSGSSSGSAPSSSAGDGSRASDGEGDEPELLGYTGSMRWVVLGLIIGLGSAVMLCLCLVFACRVSKKRKRKRKASEDESEHVAVVGMPRSRSSSFPYINRDEFFFDGAAAMMSSADASPSNVMVENKLFGVPPTNVSVFMDGSPRRASRSSFGRVVKSTSQPKGLEGARKRAMQISSKADRRTDEAFCASREPVNGSEASAESFVVTGTNASVTAPEDVMPSTVDGDGLFFQTSGQSLQDRRERSGNQHNGDVKDSVDRSQERSPERTGMADRRSPDRLVTQRVAKMPSGEAFILARSPTRTSDSTEGNNPRVQSPRRLSALPEFDWVSDERSKTSSELGASTNTKSVRSMSPASRTPEMGSQEVSSTKTTPSHEDGEHANGGDTEGLKKRPTVELYQVPSFRSRKGSAKVYCRRSDSCKSDRSVEGE